MKVRAKISFLPKCSDCTQTSKILYLCHKNKWNKHFSQWLGIYMKLVFSWNTLVLLLICNFKKKFCILSFKTKKNLPLQFLYNVKQQHFTIPATWIDSYYPNNSYLYHKYYKLIDFRHLKEISNITVKKKMKY